MTLKDLTDFLVPTIWPMTVIGLVLTFRVPLYALFERLAESLSVKNIKLKVLGVEIELTPEQAKSTLAELLRDIAELINELQPEEVKFFEIIQFAEGRRTVEDIIPGFTRDTKEHMRLGILRDRKLIRPFEDGRWQSHKHPVVTRFGKLVWSMRDAKAVASRS